MAMIFSTIRAIRNSSLGLSILTTITTDYRNTYGHSKGYNKPGRGLKGGS